MSTIIVNKFNTGMTSDPRASSGCQLCKHFDNFSKPHSLIPYRDSEGVSTINITTQALAQLKTFTMYGGNLYGLGIIDSTNKAKIYKNADVSLSTWTAPNNAEDSANGVNSGFFINYKGTFWGDAGGTRLWSTDLTTFTTSAQAITYTSITQGLIHSKDSVLYFGYTNTTASYIASKNGAGAWNITALTLPDTTLTVVSLCEYGNYLAIGCKSNEVGGSSKVFLWDRDSSVLTISESLDVGARTLSQIENIEGYIVAITVPSGTTADIDPKVTFLKSSGGDFQPFEEVPLSAGGRIVSKQKVNNRMYFGMGDVSLGATSIGGSSNDYVGVWSVGRNQIGAEFSVSFTRLVNNNTAVSGINGFILVGDYLWASFTVSGTVTLSKTNDQASYTATSVYRTVINPNMSDLDKVKKKQLQTTSLTYSPLPSAGQVVLKYKVDNESYVTCFTETTDSAQVTEVIKAGSTEFTKGRDYEFQIESTGGAEITGLPYKYATQETNL